MQGHLLSVFLELWATCKLTTGDLRPPSWIGEVGWQVFVMEWPLRRVEALLAISTKAL